MSTIKTRNCVICGSSDIAVASGHVIRRDTYIDFCKMNQDLKIIASRCENHKDNLSGQNGYYGEYKEWMGMCDDPFRKEVKKLDFTEITKSLLDIIANDDDQELRQFAQMIGISKDNFEDYLQYAVVEKIGDIRDRYNP